MTRGSNDSECYYPRAQASGLVPTIFHERWWLDIETNGNFDVVECFEDGKLVGWLPYFLKRKSGFTYSVNPKMTHFIGPAINEGNGSSETRFLRKLQITRELISKLPPASVYKYKLHRDVTDVVAFQAEQFSTNVQFTFEVPPQVTDTLWNNMRPKKRKKIRKASDELTSYDIEDPELFWHFYEKNLKWRGLYCSYYDKISTCKIIEACLTRSCGRIYAAKDKRGSLVAVLFCIWDQFSTYYYMTSRTEDAHGGATSLLVWNAMQDAAQKGLIFDFDGLTNAKSILFYAEFGGTLSPRYVVTRSTLIGGIALGLKTALDGKNFFY